MILRYVCMNDSTHSFKGRDGMLGGKTCPVCDGQVLPNYFDKQVHNTLPDYRELKENRGNRMKEFQKLINMDDTFMILKSESPTISKVTLIDLSSNEGVKELTLEWFDDDYLKMIADGINEYLKSK